MNHIFIHMYHTILCIRGMGPLLSEERIMSDLEIGKTQVVYHTNIDFDVTYERLRNNNKVKIRSSLSGNIIQYFKLFGVC